MNELSRNYVYIYKNMSKKVNDDIKKELKYRTTGKIDDSLSMEL
jgi:hypothetical protein